MRISETGPVETRVFHLKHARAAEVRILLLGTLLGVPVHLVTSAVDESANALTLTDTPARLEMVARALPALDHSSDEKDIQRRLMEMWVRLVNAYHG